MLILSHRGEDPFSFESIVMETIRTAALSFIAIFACAMLLLTPDFHRDGESRTRPPAAQASAPINALQTGFEVERKQPAIPETGDPFAVVQAQPSSSATARPAEIQPSGWALVMYPELARIEELENEPAYAAFGELLPMLSSEDPVIRLAAIEALGDMALPAALPALMAASNDPSPQLRIAALEALAAHADPLVAASIEAHLYDHEREVRLAAIDALADLESGISVHSLAGLLSDQDAAIRHHAVYALGEIGSKDAMRYLLQARYDSNAKIRLNAEAILAELEYDAAY